MRILVIGASGSGTTTLGRALAAHLAVPHFDADDYYWLPTERPFAAKREPAERLALLHGDLEGAPDAVVSGHVVNWGAPIEDAFDLIVFLYLDAAIRVERLRQRETACLGAADPEFLEWAAQYDDGRLSGRSLRKHRAWLATRRCPVLELVGDQSVEQRLAAVCRQLPGGNPAGQGLD